MAVFIETQTDPFVRNRQDIGDIEYVNRAAQVGGVRRPVRGVEIKQDTYAVLRVMKNDGSFINVIDAAGDIMEGEGSVAKTSNYTNFFIQSVAEERHEKQQIVDTFGDAFIFFFGEAPRISQVSGVLLNSNDFNWRNEFWANYDQYFRGTRLVEQNARLYLIYDDIIIEGYMLSAQAQDDTNRPHLIQFNFSIFVTGYSTISALGDPNFPPPDGGGDYTVRSYGQSVDGPRHRAIQKQTNTDIARRNVRRSGGAILASIGGLAAGIRNNALNPDPSLANTYRSIIGAYSNISSLAAQLSKNTAGRTQPIPLRQLPLRSSFRDNRDEYIGGNDYLNSRNLASPFNLSDYWQKADGAVDRSLASVVDDMAKIHDLMGRTGRALDEMRRRGTTRSNYRASTGRLASGGVRKVPFGMIAGKEA